MAETILLVEDEEKLARMVELELRYEGYEVEKAFDGRTGLERALSGSFDLVLLDIMLPQLSGMEVLRRLRSILLDNELEIWRREQPITAIPMLLLTVILIFFFWIALPLMLLGLFFGFRYQVTGPDLEDDALNGVMGSVADTAADVGRQVMDELRSQHEKSGGRKK